MSKLFNTLRDVLTPYANKINLHSEEIEDIQSDVEEIQGDVSEVKADLGDNVNDLKSVLNCISDITNITNQKSGKYNIYPDLSNHTIKIFPEATPVYSTYFPCKSGNKYIIKRTVITSRFAVATTEAVPAYQVATIDGIRDDTASELEITPTGESKYIVIWFYYYPADNSINADTALAGISIEEITGAKDNIARDEIEDINERIDTFEDVRNVTNLLSTKKNIYPQASSMLVKVFPDENPVYSVYLPCVVGYEYNVSKSVTSSRFALATTENVPSYNEPIINLEQNNSARELTLTPTGNSQYLLIWFYNTVDSSIGADTILNSISVTQNSHGVKDVYARTKIEYLENYIQFISIGDFNVSQFDNMIADNISILY